VKRPSGAEASVVLKRRYLCGILSERMTDPTGDVTCRDNMRLTEYKAFSAVSGFVAPCIDDKMACHS
jgi:hypothetical protein